MRALHGNLIVFVFGVRTAQVAINVGILAGFVAGWAFSKLPDGIAWRWMLGVGGVPPALVLLCLCGMPESPRWLVSRGRDAEAAHVLWRICGAEEAAQALTLMQVPPYILPYIIYSNILYIYYHILICHRRAWHRSRDRNAVTEML